MTRKDAAAEEQRAEQAARSSAHDRHERQKREAFEAGRRATRDRDPSLPPPRNPHRTGTHVHEAWRLGSDQNKGAMQ